MKKTSNTKSKVSPKRVSTGAPRPVKRASSEMQAHYDFDYTRSRPNRFAKRLGDGVVAVVLDPDVATVFHSAESVNAFLRSAITAMPRNEARKKKRSA
jgi:hypothetical protein